jgi:3-hydroxybutyryl-CoA dehydrogenase
VRGLPQGFWLKSVPVVILGRSKEKADACLDKAISLAKKIGVDGDYATTQKIKLTLRGSKSSES